MRHPNLITYNLVTLTILGENGKLQGSIFNILYSPSNYSFC